MKAMLVLEDGTVYHGKSFGAQGTSVGEIVFNTSMTGYQEILTDPSYYGQVITMTYPLIGNYGINSYDNESSGCFARGLIVREVCEHESNYRAEKSLDVFLKEQSVIGLYGIDTRSLTKKLRTHGVMNGAITNDPCFLEGGDLTRLLEQIKEYKIRDAVKNVSEYKKCEYKSEGGKYKIALIDYGHKANIIECLLKRGCDVTVFPYDVKAEEIINGGFDGIQLSDGPGDPNEDTERIEQLKTLFDSGIPVFGICLGHQMIALSQGISCVKMKFGHRGANHPVKDLSGGRTFITAQNHGYTAVPEHAANDKYEITHININDDTVEGIKYKTRPVFTVQFHPEASSSALDVEFLFDDFLDSVRVYNKI